MSGVLLLKRPSPFSYPGGNPGFDPTHVASAAVGPAQMFSGIAVGGNFAELTTGAVGVLFGSPTGSIVGVIGPSVSFPSNFSGTKFSGKPTSPSTQFTIAVITQIPSLGANFQSAFSTDFSGSAGGEIRIDTGVFNWNSNGGSEITSGITLQNNIPYFLAVTCNNVTMDFLALNLATGQIQSASQGCSIVTSGGSGVFCVGNVLGNIGYDGGFISAAMMTPKYVGLRGLLQWAQDPWSFWYP